MRKPLALWIALPAMVLCPSASVAQRMYFSSFQSGKLQALDLRSGKTVYQVDVEDGGGVIGLAATPGGATLLVVDGDGDGRVRVLAARTGKQLASVTFRRRALQRGGTPVAALSTDGHWLFVKTRAEFGPVGGILAFDVEKRAFAASGQAIEGCPWPELAGSPAARFLAICPDQVVELAPYRGGPFHFVAAGRVSFGEVSIAGAVFSQGAKTTYILDYPKPQQPWRILELRQGEAGSLSHGLAGFPASDGPAERQAWISMSPDEKLLGVVIRSRMALIDRRTMKILQLRDAATALQGAVFDPAGGGLITVDAVEPRIWRMSAVSGEVSQHPVAARRFGVGPSVLLLTPSPR